MLNPVSFSSRLDKAVTGVAKASPTRSDTGRHHRADQDANPPNPAATTMKITDESPTIVTT